MSGERILADTSVLIHYLSGDERAFNLLENAEVHISFVSQVELRVTSKHRPGNQQRAEALLAKCVVTGINELIKERTVRFRSTHRLKLGDSLIAATAAYLDIPLVTADRDFARLKDDIALYLF